MTGDAYTPKKEDKFSFGLWTVGNVGRDPFGDAVRKPLSAPYIVKKLSELGAYGVNFHDNDLVPFDATPAERERIVGEFKKALADHGMCVPMATVNLFTHPIFKDGGFTSNDPRVRAFGLQKTMRAMDLGVEVGARIFVLWGGREGTEADASKDGREAMKRYREALNYLCEYIRDQKYDLKIALEAKPNEPRGDIFAPTTGHMLALISTLDHPEMVGVNPEVAHEVMAGLSFHHGVAQAIEAGKLFHIDLNDQKIGRYDQDLRFGSADLRGAFFLVKLLEDAGYAGPRHFDAHPYRSEDEEGTWAFALGCMRTYNILKEKARRFNADPEIQAIVQEIAAKNATDEFGTKKYEHGQATKLKKMDFPVAAIAEKGLGYERLDQLTVELLMGAR